MGIWGKIVDTTAKKVVIDAVGKATTKVTVSAIDALGRNHILDIPNICVATSSEKCIGKNCHDVKSEFEAYGFTNVVLLPHRDLICGWITKDGAVEKVIINGKETFKKKAMFSSNARVVIVYHTFRNKKSV